MMNAFNLAEISARINQKKKQSAPPFILVIEGRVASGKTTLSKALAKIFDASVIQTDDFYLPKNKRNEERMKQVAGHMDWERFDKDVIQQLKNEQLSYQAFDCQTQTLTTAQSFALKNVIIIEGSYALLPQFGDYADLSFYLNISDEIQEKRLKKRSRSPEHVQMFYAQWIPAEKRYTEETRLLERVDEVFEFIN